MPKLTVPEMETILGALLAVVVGVFIGVYSKSFDIFDTGLITLGIGALIGTTTSHTPNP